MFKIDQESIKNFQNIRVLLEQLEIKGSDNIDIMYNLLMLWQNISKKLEELNKQEDGIKIDNTKEIK